MRKALTATLVAALALGGATAAMAHHKPGHGARGQNATAKVAICHRGHTIRVSERAVPAHVRHGDLVGACNTRAFPAPGRFVRLHAALRPVEGATGRGRADVGIGRFREIAVLCYRVAVVGVDATAAHVHTSVAQTIGNTQFAANAVVVPFKTPVDVARNRADVANGCMVISRAMARAIVMNPGNFYVNVHSAAFPNGQVQGTLVKR